MRSVASSLSMAKKWLSGNTGRIIEDLLNERRQGTAGLEGLPRDFFARAAEMISAPWTLAANADSACPRTKGQRPKDLEQGARYFQALEALSVTDVDLQILIAEVLNLVRPLADLLTASLRSRVMEHLGKSANV